MITIQAPVEIDIRYAPLKVDTRSATPRETAMLLDTRRPAWLRTLQEETAIADVRRAVNRFFYSEN